MWVTRCPTNNSSCSQSEDNPKPGQGILTKLDAENLQDRIADRISQDGSRYGHGSNGKNSNNIDDHYGGRILIEYIVYPPSTNFSALGVFFDCTRRKKTSLMQCEYGKSIVNESVSFPSVEDFANDDMSNSADEDNEPNDGKIYSWDTPGITYVSFDNSKKLAFKAIKMTFEDFVRIKVNETFPSNGGGLHGSRASHKVEWHTVLYTKSGVGNILMPDDQNISYSNPVKNSTGGAIGGGSCVVELLTNPQTDGYTIVYNQGTNKWTLTSLSNVNIVSPPPSGSPLKWVIEDPGRVKVTITNASPVFYTGNKFLFSVFRSSTGKLNETAESSYPVENGF